MNTWVVSVQCHRFLCKLRTSCKHSHRKPWLCLVNLPYVGSLSSLQWSSPLCDSHHCAWQGSVRNEESVGQHEAWIQLFSTVPNQSPLSSLFTDDLSSDATWRLFFPHSANFILIFNAADFFSVTRVNSAQSTFKSVCNYSKNLSYPD